MDQLNLKNFSTLFKLILAGVIVSIYGAGFAATGGNHPGTQVFPDLTASTVPYISSSKVMTSSAVTNTELGFLSGVTSALQTQINAKQGTGNYVTSLTGEVTASGPGAAAATLSTTAVTGKALTGFTSGSGTVSATDTILQAFNKNTANLARAQDKPGFINQIADPGFEEAVSAWTATTTAPSRTTTTAEYFDGAAGLKWVPVGADTLTGPTWTIKVDAAGNGVAFIRVKTSSTKFTFEIYDGANVVTSVAVPSANVFVPLILNFVAASAGTYKARISTTGSDTIYADNAGLGYAEGYNVGSVYSTAQLVASGHFAATASCNWTRTSATIGDVATVAACPGPTVDSNTGPGVLASTDVDLPNFTLTNLPTGVYEVEMSLGIAMSVGAFGYAQISDGTNHSPVYGFNASTTTNGSVVMSGTFAYTGTQSSITFKPQIGSASGTITLGNDTSSKNEIQFRIKRFPSAGQIPYTADGIPGSWSGYHDTTCSWARTNAALGDPTADASCALVESTNQNFGTVTTSGSVLPNIVFTPKRVGRYWACASFSVSGSTSSTATVRLLDGATTVADASVSFSAGSLTYQQKLCGIVAVTTLAAKTVSIQTANSAGSVTLAASGVARSSVEWSIFQMDQAFPTPQLVNSVINPSNGLTVTVSAFISNSGTPTVTRQDGTWISSLTDNGAGDTTINISAGTFTSAPNCICNAYGSAVTAGCNIDSSTAISTAAVRTQVVVSAAAADGDFFIRCEGPK